MAPKARVTSSATHTARLERSAHSRVAAAMATSSSAPPMVGVPALMRWVSGPSLRTVWPIW
jgi:hypothetical protein